MTELLTLVELYGCTLWAAGLSAPALAFLGVQLATRDRALQSICVGQGAVAGVLMGLGVSAQVGTDTAFGFLPIPLLSGLVFSAVSWRIADRLVRSKLSSKNTYFAGLFCILVAAGHLMASLFPSVENHMAQVYFGDLVTLSHDDSIKAAVFCGALLIFFLRFARTICRNSVDIALFGHTLSHSEAWVEKAFSVMTLVSLCLAVQYMGFLYTIALLFLPTAILSYSPVAGLKRHVLGSMVLGIVGSLTGFSVSLFFTRLPTVPAISACLFLFGCALLLKKGPFTLKK